jgi:hypothetical protein
LAGDLVAVFVWLVVVFLRAVEDTNTSRQDCVGAARPGVVKSRPVILPCPWSLSRSGSDPGTTGLAGVRRHR